MHLALLAAATLWVATPNAASGVSEDAELERYEFRQVEMAVPFRIVVYAADRKTAEQGAQAAFARVAELNRVMSDYDDESELRKLCATAGSGEQVRVSDDLWRVLSRALEIAEKSEGTFDPTIGPVTRLWRQSRRLRELPKPERLQAARELVGYKLVELDAQKKAVRLAKRGMLLDLGGIAKGYAVAEALVVLRAHKLPRALIEAGGDVGVGDAPPGTAGWLLGVGATERGGPPRQFLRAANVYVATSGDLMQALEIDGVRYSHVVDPRTGVGLTNHSLAVVVHRDGATADALAKAVGILGPDKGLAVAEVYGAAAHLQRKTGEKAEAFASPGWRKLTFEEKGGP